MGKDISGCICCRRRKKKCRSQGSGEDCLNCRLIEIECLHGYGESIPLRFKGTELTARIKGWTRRPSNHRPGSILVLSDIGEHEEWGGISSSRTGRRSARGVHPPSFVPTPPNLHLHPHPNHVSYAPPHETVGTSAPVSQPLPASSSFIQTSTAAFSPTGTLSPMSAIDSSSSQFRSSDSSSVASSPLVRSGSECSFYSSDTGSLSPAPFLGAGNVGMGPHRRQRAYSSSSASSLAPSSTDSQSLSDTYQHALHSQSELPGNPYFQDGYEDGGWLENASLSEDNLPGSERFVPGETLGGDIAAMMAWLNSEVNQFDIIDTGVPNGSTVPQIVISSDDCQLGREVGQDNLYVETPAPSFANFQAASELDVALNVHLNGGIRSTVADGTDGAGGSHHVSAYTTVPVTVEPPYTEFSYGNIDTSFAAEPVDFGWQPFPRHPEYPLPSYPNTFDTPRQGARHGLGLAPLPGSHGAGNVASRFVPVALNAPPREHSEFSQVSEDFSRLNVGLYVTQPAESSASGGSRETMAFHVYDGSSAATRSPPHGRLAR